ncbi:MAG: hypothetical protein ACTH5N_06710 [Psychroflexus halocasei]
MEIILGIVLIAIGGIMSFKTFKDLLSRDFDDMIQANNVKIIFGEITLIIVGILLLIGL